MTAPSLQHLERGRVFERRRVLVRRRGGGEAGSQEQRRQERGRCRRERGQVNQTV